MLSTFRRVLFFSALLFSATFFPGRELFAGMKMTFEDKGSHGKPSQAVSFSVEGKKLRAENPNGMIIFDGDAQKLWTIDPNQKSYSEITEADAARVKEMRERMEKQMREQMDRMPPEQRSQMEEALERRKQEIDRPPRALTFEPLEGTKKNNRGFSCKPYRVIENGKPIEEICFIPWKDAGVSLQDFEAFNAYEQFLKKLGADSGSQNRIFQDLKQSPGIPAIVTTLPSENAPARSQELTELKRETIPPAQFAISPDFQKRPTSAAPGGTGRSGPGSGAPHVR